MNAANRRMRGGGGVDGAIHRAGGPGVLEDCVARFPHGLPPATPAGRTAGELPARWVIHVVGPNHRAGETDRALLVSCYARRAGASPTSSAPRTVAFPLVSRPASTAGRATTRSPPPWTPCADADRGGGRAAGRLRAGGPRRDHRLPRSG